MENKSDGKSWKIIYPSPNEEEAIIKNAFAERRKQRLLQVRNQEKKLSGKIRNAVKNKREKEIHSMKLQLKREWDINISKEIDELEKEYRKRIETLGKGHKSINKVPVKDTDQIREMMEQRALERYEEAMMKLGEQRAALKLAEKEKIDLRKRVAKAEQSRASLIASKPPQDQDFALKIKNLNRQSTLASRTRTTTDSFSSTRFHMPNVYVEKADHQPQTDACKAARELEGRITEAKALLEKDLNERKEKANLRHQHARQQVLLDQSKDRLLEQLEGLEYQDRFRRRKILSKIPKQVYQPPYQRLEDEKAKQIMLEEAFENAHFTNRDLHKDGLNLDLEDKDDAPEKESKQPENLSSHEDTAIQLPLSTHAENEASQQESDADSGLADRQPSPRDGGRTDEEESKQNTNNRAKRMQKLLGRIRKQQDEWTKQHAKWEEIIKPEENVKSGAQNENESSDSLLSADVDSARYTNTETTDNDNGKPESETFSDVEKNEEDVFREDKEDSLLHPFEKAKLIRSVGRRLDLNADELTNSSSIDISERKKTLENQKHLFKIQKQRLENQMLRRELQTTEKALENLVDEGLKQNQEEDVSDVICAAAGEYIGNMDGNGDREVEDLISNWNDNRIDFGLQGDVVINEESNERETFAGIVPPRASNNLDSIVQGDVSFAPSLTGTKREELSRRYPNIFKGLSFEQSEKDVTQTGLEVASAEANAGNMSADVSAIHGMTPTDSALLSEKEEPSIKGSSHLKPKVEIGRIRKYQQQLLQKQKWWKSRHDIIQKRHEAALADLNTGDLNDSKHLKAVHSGTVDVNGGYSVLSNNVADLENRNRPSSTEPLFNATRVADHGDDGRAASVSVVGEKTKNRDSERKTFQDDDELEQNIPPRVSNSSHLDAHVPPSRWQKDVGVRISTQDREWFTNKIADLIPEANGEGRQERILMQNKGSERRTDEDNGAGSNLDDVQNLLKEVNSIHFQTTASTTEAANIESQANEVVRRSHRAISGKPPFSPIQEVEETSFKDRINGISSAITTQGAVSVSSLAEQELPLSNRTSSGTSHSSPVRSTRSNEKPETPAFNLQELASSLSEIDYLPLPLPVATASIPKQQIDAQHEYSPTRHEYSPTRHEYSPTRHLSDDSPTVTNAPLQAAGGVWTPLQPYDSGKKDEGGLVWDVDHRGVLKATDGAEKEPPTPVSRSIATESEHGKQNEDLIEVGNLQVHASEFPEIDGLVLPDIPRLHSPKPREKNSTTSMKETDRIHVDQSISPNSSKGSSIKKYEEILDRVRMLPYKHLQEYNKLSESYMSWRKETVEPLLRPNIPQSFSGFDVNINREIESNAQEIDDEIQSGLEGTVSNNAVFATLKTDPVHREMESGAGSDVKMSAQSDAAGGIEWFEPVRGDFHLLDKRFGSRERVASERGREDGTTHDFKTESALPLHISDSVNANVTSSGFVSHDAMFDRQDISGSLLSDQLTEQNIDENGTDCGEEIDTVHAIKQENEASLHKEVDDYQETGFILNQIEIASSESIEKQIESNRKEIGHDGVGSQTAKPDSFVRDDRTIQLRLSSLGDNSVERSNFTNSSSNKSKTRFLSEIQSDETVSELARLWSLTSQSIKPDSYENEISSLLSQPESTSLYTLPLRSSKGKLSSRSSSYHGSNIAVKGDSVLSSPSKGFKDPNNYEISLHQSSSLETFKTDPDSGAASYKCDDSASIPSLLLSASARLTTGRISSPTPSGSSLETNMEHGFSGSMQSNAFNEIVEGHSDTSWLLPSSTHKVGAANQSDSILEPRNSNELVATASFNVFDSDATDQEDIPKESRHSLITSSDDRTDDDGIVAWNELLATQASGSSAKESDGELPELYTLRNDAYAMRSQQFLQQIRNKGIERQQRKTKYRVDGRLERNVDRKDSKTMIKRENKRPKNVLKVHKSENILAGSKSKDAIRPRTKTQSDQQRLSNEEIMQENRRRMKQFQKKVQSSLRNRKK